jgi:hypothetical protein
MLDPWDFEGDVEMTEHWRTVVPALSIRPAEDLTSVANAQRRATSVRQRYMLELKHLARRGGSWSSVTSSLTRISDWSELTPEERATTRSNSPFALCRGVPSGLSGATHAGLDDGLDFALLISVPPTFLPSGPFFLEGVPLVIHRVRRVRPLPSNAELLWPSELAIPAYPADDQLTQR